MIQKVTQLVVDCDPAVVVSVPMSDTDAGVGNDPGRNRKCPSDWTESKPGSELGKGREGQGPRFPLFTGFYTPVGTVMTFLIHIRDGVTSTCRKFGMACTVLYTKVYIRLP